MEQQSDAQPNPKYQQLTSTATATMHTVHAEEHDDTTNTAEQELKAHTVNNETPAVDHESKADEGGDGMNLSVFQQTTGKET